MAKVTCLCLLFSLILLTQGLLPSEGANCIIALGACGKGNDCDHRCKKATKKRGVGECSRPPITPPLCTCYDPAGCPRATASPETNNSTADLATP